MATTNPFDLIKQRLNQVKQTTVPTPKSKFQEAEDAGRKLFAEWCLKNKMVPQFSDNEISAYDAYIPNTNSHYEIKNLDCNYEDFKYRRLIEQEGLLLEETKYNGLHKLWLQDTSKAFFYWMRFKDKLFIHQIDFGKRYKLRFYNCQETSVGNRNKITKRIFCIDFKDLVVSNIN